jgi:hypothetical protein
LSVFCRVPPGDDDNRQRTRSERGRRPRGDRRQKPAGRTKDKNIGYIAEYLTALGIDLKEVRVVG